MLRHVNASVYSHSATFNAPTFFLDLSRIVICPARTMTQYERDRYVPSMYPVTIHLRIVRAPMFRRRAMIDALTHPSRGIMIAKARMEGLDRYLA